MLKTLLVAATLSAAQVALASSAPVDLSGGLSLKPLKDLHESDRCKEEKSYYRLRGLKDRVVERKVNALMREAVTISEGCATPSPEADESLPYSFGEEIQSPRRLGDALVFKVQRSSYTGGVHGNYGYKTHVLSLAQGSEIDLDKLLLDRGREALAELTRAKLTQYYARQGRASEPGRKSLEVRMDQVLPSGNGFQVQYDPYEIDCFAAGAPVITYTAEEAARVFQPTPLTAALFGLKP
jgi:hypothetical protein